MDLVLHNREILPKDQVLVSLDSIDVSYGYGVYETMKVRKGILYYPEFHEERLFDSARFLGIHHDFQPGEVIRGIRSLLAGWREGVQEEHQRDRADNCNLKILMIGHTGKPADLYGFILGPLFPDRKELKQGTRALVYPGERHFPQAKSLSMLMSTIAFRSAQALGCYDALLLNRHHQITEGTRTNLFYYFAQEPNDELGKPETIFTPPLSQVLNGITRRTIIDCFTNHGIKVEEQPLSLSQIFLENPPALFVSSTSTKIMPMKELHIPWTPEPGSWGELERMDELGSKAHRNYLDSIGITEPADVHTTKIIPLEVPKSMKYLQEIYNEYLDRWSQTQ